MPRSWQTAIVDAEIMADGDSEVKNLAEEFWRRGLCSEPPSVLVRRQKRKPDCHAKVNGRFALFDALNAEAQKMKENNLKKLMIYYKGHGASTVQEYTVCPDAALVLEDQVVDAVERHKLEYACVIVFVDSCRVKWRDKDDKECPAYSRPKVVPGKTNTYIFVYFCELYYPLRDSSVVPKALMHMIQAQSDCTIGDFLERMSQLLLKLTLGRIDMKWLVLSASDALGWHFFPTGYQSPFDREEVVVMPQEHYDALTDNLCVWGCLDRMVDDVFSLPEMLHDAEVMSHMISELRSIADIFFAKKDLVRVDWRQEIYVAMCRSLGEVRVTLENVAQDPGSSHSDSRLPDPFYKCLVKARKQGYRKLQRENLHHMDHIKEVVNKLGSYVDQVPPDARDKLEIQEMCRVYTDTKGKEHVEIHALYLFRMEDGIASEILKAQPRLRLRRVEDEKVVKWGSRFYLGPGAACLCRTFSIHSQLERGAAEVVTRAHLQSATGAGGLDTSCLRERDSGAECDWDICQKCRLTGHMPSTCSRGSGCGPQDSEAK
ncbi:unnamed protein product [Effrenium voratum]|nr:unnamed protein product [Effrenium voratum]